MNPIVRRVLLILAAIGLGDLGAAAPSRAFFAFDVTATSTGNVNDYPAPGDQITLDIRLRNSGIVFGLEAAVYGYNSDVVSFVSGDVVRTMLYESCPQLGCPRFFTNLVRTPVEASLAGFGPYVQFATSALTLSGTAGDGSLDTGLDFTTTGALFRLTFRVLQPGPVQFWVGTDGYPQLGNVILRAGGVTEQAVTQITFTPEPGTAFLIGLGLAGLSGSATIGRSRRARQAADASHCG